MPVPLPPGSGYPFPMEKTDHASELSALRLSLILYAFLFAAKLAVYFFSGSLALLAEALHTMADILVTGFLLLALHLSRRQEDADHMYGHGKAQYAAALVAATIFLSFTVVTLVKEALPRLIHPGGGELRNLPLALGVLLASLAVGMWPLLKLWRQKVRGAAAHAQMMEAINDQLGLLAALAGTLAVAAGFPLGDPVAALAVAAIIAINAAGLFRENLSYLLGRSPGKEFLDQVRETARAVPGVREVHFLRGQRVGPDAVQVELHIKVDRGMTVEAADSIAEEVHRRLHQQAGCRYISIHTDPA